MSFDKVFLAHACKLCLNYIFNYNERVDITEEIHEKIVDLTNLQISNSIQNYICTSCHETLYKCVQFRAEAIANMEKVNNVIENSQSEQDEEEDEEDMEFMQQELADVKELYQVNQLSDCGRPYVKVVYEEDEIDENQPCSSKQLKERENLLKRKINDTEELIEIEEKPAKKPISPQHVIVTIPNLSLLQPSPPNVELKLKPIFTNEPTGKETIIVKSLSEAKPPSKKVKVEKIPKAEPSPAQPKVKQQRPNFKTIIKNVCMGLGSTAVSLQRVMEFCGYKNADEFRKKIKSGLTNEEVITRMENAINNLTPIELNQLGILVTNSAYTFSQDQVDTLDQIFFAVEQIVTHTPLQPSSNSKYKDMNASNIQSYVDERLSKEVLAVTQHDIKHFPIVKSEVTKFPFKVFVECIKCRSDRLITATEYVKGNYVYRNLRTNAYITHLKTCTGVKPNKN